MFLWVWGEVKNLFGRFSTKLMGLYLVLLLVPVSGLGLYGHHYIQQALSQYLIQSYLDEIDIHATNLELMLSHVRQDVLYLKNERVQSTNSGYASVHAMYRNVMWVDASEQLMDSRAVQNFANDESLRLLLTDTIHLNPLVRADGTTSLAAITRDGDRTLLVEIDTQYLLQGITSHTTADAWSLWLGEETVLTTAQAGDLADLSMAQFTDDGGYIMTGNWFHTYHKIGNDHEWVLVQTLPIDMIRPDLQSYYTTFSILLIGGLVSVVGFALFGIARIIEPVYQLTQRVEGVRRGEVPHPFPNPLPTDEFGTLMSAFDQMAVELEHQRRIERELVEQLINAQEEERKMIAYDLHDGLIQQLVGARFYLQSSSQSSENVAYGYDVLTNSIAEGRRIIQGLHPTVLDDLGLEAALEDCCNTMARMAGWEQSINLETLKEQPDRVTSVTLFRVAQEALNNAFKHAKATQIWLTLTCTDDRLCLCVQDNGCGFDVDYVLEHNKGWGIRTMRERATMLHGTHTIESTLQKGTTVCVTVPHQC